MLTYISIILICKFLGIRLGKAEKFADQKLDLIKAYIQKKYHQPITNIKTRKVY